MKHIHSIIALMTGLFIANANAEDFNIKYSSNYLMPAYVRFQNGKGQYNVQAKINVPLYNIVFSANGTEKNNQFTMVSYRDKRNGKTYSMTEVDSTSVQYGKLKDQPFKQEALKQPIFDLFTMAFQLSYYDKLPTSFQITNGKKLYPMENVVVQKSQQNISEKGKNITQITYHFKTGNKDIVVKKYQGEKFPRFISYNRDGDNYQLEFDSFVK